MTNVDNVCRRNNVTVIGSGKTTLMLAHGFGCDQQMWRFLLPKLEADFKVVLFDYVGCGNSDFSAFEKNKYSSLSGYAEDVIDICDELNLSDVVFLGHSVSSIIGMHAAIKAPQFFSKLVMICPSPCFINLPPDYMGGFDKEDLEELINLMDKNYIGWASYLAPLVMGQKNNTNLINELEEKFCSTDPNFAKPFAKATFFSDDRAILSQLKHQTLILQSKDDNLASVEIGRYMQQHLPNASLEILDTHGHCVHMTHPSEVFKQLKRFLG